MILMTGWRGETDFIDPMCGSGTLPIEAALIAKNIAPGVFRQGYAFEKWPDFDADLFETIYNDDSAEREFEHHVYGYDYDMRAVNTAKMNVKAAGLSDCVTIEEQDFKDWKGHSEPAIIVTNPPYGERISTSNLQETYRMIGQQFKRVFKEGDAWVLSYKEECFQQIGLKPSQKVPLYNGSLECEFRKYTLFSGKYNDFRADGGVVKTDEDKRQMAEKRRSWQRRDFEKEQEARQDNEDADILTFKFRSLEKRDGFKGKREDRDFKGKRDFDRNDRDFKGKRDFKDKRDERDFKGKRDFKADRDFKRGDKFDRNDRKRERKNIFGSNNE